MSFLTKITSLDPPRFSSTPSPGLFSGSSRELSSFSSPSSIQKQERLKALSEKFLPVIRTQYGKTGHLDGCRLRHEVITDCQGGGVSYKEFVAYCKKGVDQEGDMTNSLDCSVSKFLEQEIVRVEEVAHKNLGTFKKLPRHGVREGYLASSEFPKNHFIIIKYR